MRILFYGLMPFITGTAVLMLGAVVFGSNKSLERNKAMLFLTIGQSIWLYSFAIMNFFPNNMYLAEYLSRFVFLGVSLIVIMDYHFIMSFLNLKNRLMENIVNWFGIVFTIIALFTSLFVSRIKIYFWGPYPQAGNIVPLYIAYLAVVFIYCLNKVYESAYGYRRKQISEDESNRAKYVFWAFLFGNVAAIDFIQAFGIELYPLGYINILVMVLILAYAFSKHKILDIEIAIKKTVVFASLFAAVYAIVAGFTFLTQGVFHKFIGRNRWIALVPSITTIVIMLRPLENYILRVTDRFLFRKKYDYRELLKTFATEVLTVLDKDKIVKTTVRNLTSIMQIKSCGVLLFNKTKNIYELLASVGLDKESRTINLSTDNTLASFLERTKTYLSTKQQEKDVPLPTRVIEDMNKLKLELAIPLIIHADMIGILTLGKKKSDREYTPEDMDILLTLARTLAIAISNATVLDELGRTQAEAAQKEKMAVIGTLSAGINHEICNPLGIIRGQCETFLLNYKDGLYKDTADGALLEKSEAILKKVIHQTDRATIITKRLSSFAKPSKGELHDEVDVRESVEEVLALVGYEMKLDDIEVLNEVPEDFPRIVGDKKQIQEVFFNLIRNAAQAVAEEGKIMIRSFKQFDMVRIEIEDTGPGIPSDKIGQIFNPFFTTKEPGQGSGLGLFIVRQVVERNGGRISVKSEKGEGTVFYLDFPIAQDSNNIA